MRFRLMLIPMAFLAAVGFSAYLGCTPNKTDDAAGGDADQATQQQDGSGEKHSNHAHNAETPDGAVLAFLNAVRAGDEETAAAMLTTKARTEMQNAEMYVQPPGSPHAQFTIGEVRLMPEHGGAHVDSSWTDVVENGDQRTYEITWILRQEQNAWRVAGMSTRLFSNQPPLVLNFEDPADMQAQVQQANAEMARRSGGEGEIRQATLPSEQDSGVR